MGSKCMAHSASSRLSRPDLRRRAAADAPCLEVAAGHFLSRGPVAAFGDVVGAAQAY